LGIDPADWMLLASIRDSENYLFDLSSEGYEVGGITSPREMASWLKRAGYREVTDWATALFNASENVAREAANRKRRGHKVCLLINDHLVNPKPSHEKPWPIEYHWVVLTEPIIYRDASIRLQIYSHGQRLDLPKKGKLSKAEFLANFYGFVSAKP